ncbi:MAG TPA: DNA topoisomerase IB [Xanthomonadales bacterium]|nr:DNA topoisomerase IB [Xanthomonadales bacterium]
MRAPERPRPGSHHDARRAGLRHVRDDEPGLLRRRAGKGFAYLRADGRPVRDAETLARIRALAVPPAWRDVWICRDATGHVQATGRDARGRKQYRYHPLWRRTRDEGKYERMAAFARRLPALRRRIARDLRAPGLPRDKVLAMAVAVMSRTLIRVGNEEYARSNGSYGLTTLRDSNVRFVRGGRARIGFRGKGGLAHDVVLDDARLVRLLRRCRELPGQALFQYVDEGGRRCGVDSGMVNDYLRAAMGANYTAKDFRTWGGTLHAIEVLARTSHPRPPSQRALDACVARAVREVATHLRNTPAVCRSSYIHPAVLAAWCDGSLHRRIPEDALAGPRLLERAALGFLQAIGRGAGAVRKPKASHERAARTRRPRASASARRARTAHAAR